MRRIASLWARLPAFRAAAESAHLPSASQLIGVSAPALSRTLRLVEQSTGVALFDRVGRRIVLNDAGAHLLGAVRDAMRIVDEAIDALAGTELVGSVRLSTTTHVASPIVVQAICLLRQLHPGISLHVHSGAYSSIASRLHDGTTDIALTEQPPRGSIRADDIVCVPVCTVDYSIYCGRTHPLFGKPAKAPTLAKYAFVANSDEDDENWPTGLARIASAKVKSIHEMVALCASGEFLAVLPDVVIPTSEKRSLWRIRMSEIQPRTVYVAHRKPVAKHPRIDAVVHALTQAAQEVARKQR